MEYEKWFYFFTFASVFRAKPEIVYLCLSHFQDLYGSGANSLIITGQKLLRETIKTGASVLIASFQLKSNTYI